MGRQPAERVDQGAGQAFNGAQPGGKKISLADLIVPAGNAAIEAAAKQASHDVKVPFAPGDSDAPRDQTNVESFAVLERKADGFRNYARNGLEGPRPPSWWWPTRSC